MLKSDHRYFPLFILVFLAVIWGSSFILIKRGLDAFSPVQVGALRVTISALVLAPFAVLHLKKYLKEHWAWFLLFATLSNLMPAILFAVAESQISSSLAGILNSMTPIFTFIIGVLFFSSPFRRNQLIGLSLGITGSVLLILKSSGTGFGNINFYAFFVVLATIFYGFSSNIVKKRFSEIPPAALTSLSFLTILPISVVLLLSTDIYGAIATHEMALASLGYITILSVVGTAIALVLFNKLIQTTTPVFASTVTYLIPVVAVVWGFIDGEHVDILHIISMGMIVGGIYFINYKK